MKRTELLQEFRKKGFEDARDGWHKERLTGVGERKQHAHALTIDNTPQPSPSLLSFCQAAPEGFSLILRL